MENTQSEQQKENKLKQTEQNLRDPWGCNRKSSICFLTVPEEEEKRG